MKILLRLFFTFCALFCTELFAGSLKVNLSPASAVTAGARWRVDGGTWRVSGYTATNLTDTIHQVTFKPVTGWITPAAVDAIITTGNTTTLSAIYVPAASLQITLTPTNGRWRIDGGSWRNNGVSVSGLTPGNHTIDYSSVSGYISPLAETVTLVSGQTTSFARSYTQLASLKLTLVPTTAQWRVDGGAWKASGATVGSLTPGAHTLDYNTLAGYAAPASESVTLISGQTTTLARTYTQLASLKITLSPTTAQWRVDGGAWKASAAAVANLTPGMHTVDFNALAGYSAPASETVTLVSGQNLSLSRSYSLLAKISVNLNPATAQWNIDGGLWQPSGATVANLTPGSHSINYAAHSDYSSPASESVSLTAGQLLTLSRSYTQLAQISINLIPATGQWRTTGAAWQSSGASLSVVPGSQFIEYATLADFDSPTNESVSLAAGENFTATRTYTTTKPSLQINLTPASGQWRIDDGAWQSSGTAVADLTAGNHSVDYFDIGGSYDPLPAETISLALRENATLARSYPIKPPSSLTITLNPATAQWRVDAGLWQPSGATVSDLAYNVSHTIDYESAAGFIAPASETVTPASGQNVTLSRAYTPLASFYVNLTPSSAQWRIDGGAWNISGPATILNNLALGTHTVEFSDVIGYITPASETVTLVSGPNAPLERSYIPLASFYVNLTPSSAQWRIDGGAWNISGPATILNNLTLGDHTIEFSDVLGYIAPASETVTLVSGPNAPLDRTYTRLASFYVNLTPSSAQWRIDGGAWNISGPATILYNLTLGDHTIEFSDVVGYITPASETVTLLSGPNAPLDRTYTQLASVYVNLTPSSAQWRIDGGAWLTSGAMVANLALGSHAVDYAAFTGYTAPASETVTLTAGQAATLTRSYTELPASLTVTLTPTTAQWRVNGGAWQASGATVTSLTSGSHLTEFSAVIGYTTPATRTITLSPAETKNLAVTYVAQFPATIGTQPTSQSISSGATATLSVTASGVGPLSYQWYQGATGTTTTPISGATSASYTTPALTATTSYWVRVTNSAGAVDSSTAVITVVELPTITTQPASATIPSGGNSVLTVVATGSGLSYQWYQGASGTTANPISGATNANYTTPALTMTASYWVRVTNSAGAVNSATAIITAAGYTLNAMGNQGYGQLGDGESYPSIPKEILSGASKVSAGRYNSFVIKTDGTLWGMGGNQWGQLGDGSGTTRSTPVQVVSGVASVSVGEGHTMFVKTDGTLWGVGVNSSGQLGAGTATYSYSTPVQVASGVASVSAGGSHTMFVKTDGTLWATGSNYSGQLGDGTSTGRSTPVQVASGVASVSAGGDHTMFVKTDGTLWAMGALPSGNKTTPILIASGVATVSSGRGHTLFVKLDSTLWAMGSNFYGQLGDGTTTARSTPMQVASGVASVSASNNHTAFVKTDATLWAMGEGSFGQLGDGAKTNRSTPVQVANGVSTVAAGYNHTMFVKANGMLCAVGYNGDGQLGDETKTNRSTAIQIADGVAATSAGTQHTMFVKTDSTLWATGTLPSGIAPTPILIASGVATVSSGAWHTLFIKMDGTLWGVGANGNSQLGDGTTTSRSTPVQVASGVASVSSGNYHSAFVKTDATLWVMGSNFSGQLGDGTTTARRTPVQVTSGVATVSAGADHTMFVKADGTLWAMGDNLWGQLGDGTTTNRSIPVQVASGVATVETGDSHTMFVKTDGTLWGMGANSSGQLGVGITSPQRTPLMVASGVATISAGKDYTMFVKTDGTLWTMGKNEYGQLGDGTTINRATPVKVASGVFGASAGGEHSMYLGTALALSISNHPLAQAFTTGQAASMNVVTAGSGVSYQWYQGTSGTITTPISGATNASYTTSSLSATTSYWVRVSNAGGSVDSNTATITISIPTPPTITAQPVSQSIPSGTTATLSVTASGTAPLGYQWFQYLGGVTSSPINGATSANFITPPLSATTAYWVRVYNAAGATDSSMATITTIGQPATAQLSVVLNPSNAQWRVDGGMWQASGATVGGLAGSVLHTIDYAPVAGFSVLASETFTPASGQLLSLNRSYIPLASLASLSVTLSAPGAQWRIDSGAWNDGATILNNLSIGTHLIEYSDVIGYITPGSEAITLVSGPNSHNALSYTQLASLNVYLPTSGAQWRIDSGAWNYGAAFLYNLSLGTHLIEYSDVIGYITPGSQAITLVSGPNSHNAPSYTQLASLNVYLPTSGAQWRIDGGAWNYGAAFLYNLSLGTHLIEYSDVIGYITPGSQAITLTSGPNSHNAPSYTQLASLYVNLTTSGAQWRIDGGAWNYGATILNSLSLGTHLIEYSDVIGYIAPVSEAITLVSGPNSHNAPSYTQLASLYVNLNTSGALWRIDGGAWNYGATILNNLSIGQHLIEYSDVIGYSTPSSEAVTLVSGPNSHNAPSYIQDAAISISLDLGYAQWRVDGGEWNTSGSYINNLSIGTHTIEYSQHEGYTSPPSESVTLLGGYNPSLSRSYTAIPAFYADPALATLSISLQPTFAEWRLDGGSWNTSGAFLHNLSLGTHSIEYSTVGGYITPPADFVTLHDGYNSYATSYTELAILNIYLEPAQGQWRVDGGAWHDRNAVVGSLALGSHTIEYAPVAGYVTLPAESVTLTSGLNPSLFRSYASLTPAQITITTNPASGQWRIYPQQASPTGEWKSSGATVASLNPGSYSVEYAPIAGYTLPSSTSVELLPNDHQMINATYAPIPAQFKIILFPHTGKYRINGGAWNPSGSTTMGAAPGNYLIEFQDLAGYPTPAPTTITLNPGDVKEFVYGYGPLPPPTLTFNLTPNTGLWRVDGGSWNASGTTVTNLTMDHIRSNSARSAGTSLPQPQTCN